MMKIVIITKGNNISQKICGLEHRRLCTWAFDDNCTIKNLVDRIIKENMFPWMDKRYILGAILNIKDKQIFYYDNINKKTKYYIDDNLPLKFYQLDTEIIEAYFTFKMTDEYYKLYAEREEFFAPYIECEKTFTQADYDIELNSYQKGFLNKLLSKSLKPENYSEPLYYVAQKEVKNLSIKEQLILSKNIKSIVNKIKSFIWDEATKNNTKYTIKYFDEYIKKNYPWINETNRKHIINDVNYVIYHETGTFLNYSDSDKNTNLKQWLIKIFHS